MDSTGFDPTDNDFNPTPSGDLLGEADSVEPAESERMYQLTESDLQRILSQARLGPLPPDTFVDVETGQPVRKVYHPTGRVTRDGKMVYHILKRPVILISGSGQKAIYEACLQAKATHSDVYHPRAGWLRDGWCKEVDEPENLGIGATEVEIHLEEMPTPDYDVEQSTRATVHGIVADPSTGVESTLNTAEARSARRQRRATRESVNL